MKNRFEIRGEITVIFLNSAKHGTIETLIDTDDLKRVQDFPNTWYPNWSQSAKRYYVVGSLPRNGGSKKFVRLHRWVTQAPTDLVVDHRNSNTLDNRQKSNLRVCNVAENNHNRRVMNGGSSKYKGVYWQKDAKKYQSSIKANNKSIYLGLFDSEIEAARAYNEAAKKYHGEYAHINIFLAEDNS